MDPVTQALLGGNVALLLAKKSYRRQAAVIGSLAAMAPDLDVVIRSSNNPSLFFTYHRHFTHAVSFILIGGLIVALAAFLLRPIWRQHWRETLKASVAGYATHGILDAFTSYGTLLWWPFSDKRVAFDFISIIDPVFTGALLLGFIFTFKKHNLKPAIFGLIFAMSYLSFAGFQHYRATQIQLALIKSRNQTVNKRRVLPAFGQVFHWVSLYKSNGNIYRDPITTPLFSPAFAKTGNAYKAAELSDLSSEQIRQSWLSDAKTFYWFSDGFVSAFSSKPLIWVDMRYLARTKPTTALWGIIFPSSPQRQHVIKTRQVQQQSV